MYEKIDQLIAQLNNEDCGAVIHAKRERGRWTVIVHDPSAPMPLYSAVDGGQLIGRGATLGDALNDLNTKC